MRKKYAVFIGAITFDNQRRILEGIRRRTREQGDDVFVFTCHVNWTESPENKRGAFNIMKLPDLAGFDGAILVKNSIHYEETAQELVERIRRSGIPAVSIDEPIEGMHNVGISSYEAERMVVEHLVSVHGLRRINYVTGPMNNQEAQERYWAYREVLAENGIPFEEERVYFGNFAAESGTLAVREFLRRVPWLPEAIVFANDNMALGGMHELSARGYQVPRDVLVAGFDNDEMSRVNIPSITTVNRNQEDIGYLAVECLEGRQETLANLTVKPLLELGESCGCVQTTELPTRQMRMHYCEMSIDMERNIDAVKSMSMELAGLESPKALYEKLKNYVIDSDMQAFYLCMCEEEGFFQLKETDGDYQFNIPEHNSSYTERVHIPLAYRNGMFGSYGTFPSAEVLPESCYRGYEPSCYIVFPVAYREVCYGYCVVEGSPFALKSELVYSWVVNIGIALENIRKWTLLDQMVKKLNRMWMYDMLTHIYNRMGFFHYSGRLLKKLRESEKNAYILFLDLDGLKKTNDSLGHEMGDKFISEMADVLRNVLPGEALLMRYGGDEFVAFGGCESEDEAQEIVMRIKANMQKRNDLANRDYTLAASFGLSVYRAQEIENLSALIDVADKKMYEEKLRKHQR